MQAAQPNELNPRQEKELEQERAALLK